MAFCLSGRRRDCSARYRIEGDGLVTREHYPKIPPREYTATEIAQALASVAKAIGKWGTESWTPFTRPVKPRPQELVTRELTQDVHEAKILVCRHAPLDEN